MRARIPISNHLSRETKLRSFEKRLTEFEANLRASEMFIEEQRQCLHRDAVQKAQQLMEEAANFEALFPERRQHLPRLRLINSDSPSPPPLDAHQPTNFEIISEFTAKVVE